MKCVICKNGATKEGRTTVTFDRDGLTLVVKDVPAQVCSNCGEDYVEGHVAHEILTIAERMAKSGAHVDIRRYVPGSATPCQRVQSLFFHLFSFPRLQKPQHRDATTLRTDHPGTPSDGDGGRRNA